ncbi:hypothetical protein A9Q88_11950 [Gammaproteobacteria bacterium 50_400_T64]|nr:hypothetical protein A9Q88_11950 [Gammaproteobacteria bacterium 50_400_T64]
MATANTTITPAEYLTMLESHDWYYSYSDDVTVSRAGRASYAQLTAIAESSEAMTALFKAFCDHIHQGADKPSIEALQPETTPEAEQFTIHTDVVTGWRTKSCNIQLLNQVFNARQEAEEMLALVKQTTPKAFIKQTAAAGARV